MSRKMILMKDLIQEITMGPFGSDIKVDNFIDNEKRKLEIYVIKCFFYK